MIGWGEALVVFLIVLIFLGPKHIPEAARMMAKLMRHFHEAKEELRRNLSLDEVDKIQRDFRDTWRSPHSVFGSLAGKQDSEVPPEDSAPDTTQETLSPDEEPEPPGIYGAFAENGASDDENPTQTPAPSDTDEPQTPKDAT